MNLEICRKFEPYSQPPAGYMERHEWAQVQLRAGLRQKLCGFCSLWKFPQELVGDAIVTQAETSRGTKVNQIWHVCEECSKKESVKLRIKRLM